VHITLRATSSLNGDALKTPVGRDREAAGDRGGCAAEVRTPGNTYPSLGRCYTIDQRLDALGSGHPVTEPRYTSLRQRAVAVQDLL
jgi:hypothetical protein